MSTVSPKVSVLVPVFNVELFLEECLESVINQTLKDIEIICINDGSTDNSLEIINRYAKKDARIVVIDKKNSGYGDSMNAGLKKATGEYIAIVESDDWIELSAFEELYATAAKHDVDVIKGNYFNYYTDPKNARKNGTIARLVHHEEVDKVINPADTYHIYLQQPAIWAGMYKRSFLEEKGIQFLPSAGASYQDTGFNFKVWASTNRAYFIDKAFLHYRRDNEASSVNSPGKVFCISDEFAEIEKYLKKNDLYDTFGARLRLAKWGAYYWNIDRLTAELATEFIQFASKEYKKDAESGVFNFELCNVNQVRALSELIHAPDMVIARKKASVQAKVSVIVPVYNAESYLRRSLDSVIGQTLKDIEIILVDDGSIDDSSDIVEEYFAKDPRVRVISQFNNGQASARNRAIELAHAPYLAFIDSDDYYELRALEKLYKAIKKDEADISVGSIRVIYQDRRLTAMEKNADRLYYTVKLRGKQPINDALTDVVDASPCNKLFKKSIIDEYDLRFPEGLRYEDAYFFHAFAWAAQTATFLPPEDHVYNYVRRLGSTMDQTFSGVSFAYDHIEIAIRLFEFLKENNLLNIHADYFIKLFEEYFTLSLAHSPDDEKERTYARVRDFLERDDVKMYSVSASIKDRLGELLPTPPVVVVVADVSPVPTVKSKLRGAVKKALPKFSVSYRAQQRMLHSIEALHQKVDTLRADVDEKNHLLKKQLDEVSDFIERKK